jgi:hypothetical protein
MCRVREAAKVGELNASTSMDLRVFGEEKNFMELWKMTWLVKLRSTTRVPENSPNLQTTALRRVSRDRKM